MRFIIKINDDLVEEIVKREDFEDINDFINSIKDDMKTLFGDDPINIVIER